MCRRQPWNNGPLFERVSEDTGPHEELTDAAIGTVPEYERVGAVAPMGLPERPFYILVA